RRGAESDGDERLSLAAREDRGSVRSGKHPDLRRDRPDLGKASSIDSPAPREDLATAELLKNVFVDPLGQRALRGVLRRNPFLEYLQDASHRLVALDLAADRKRFEKRAGDARLDLRVELGRKLLRADLPLRAAECPRHLLLELDDLHDFAVTE